MFANTKHCNFIGFAGKVSIWNRIIFQSYVFNCCDIVIGWANVGNLLSPSSGSFSNGSSHIKWLASYSYKFYLNLLTLTNNWDAFAFTSTDILGLIALTSTVFLASEFKKYIERSSKGRALSYQARKLEDLVWRLLRGR